MCHLHQFQGERYNLVVMGGGIQGAALAWLGANAGLRVALIEREDFGHAASANSLKILHGGLRHLQHLNFRRMRESNRARRFGMLFQPNLVKPQTFVLPTRGLGPRARPLLRAALAVNDLVSRDRNRDLPPGMELRPGRILSRADMRAILGAEAAVRFDGGACWQDALVDDTERFTLSLILGAEDVGADVVNYAEIQELAGDAGVKHLTLRDRLRADDATCRAEVVVLAVGGWLPACLRALNMASAPEGRWVKAYNLVVRKPLFGDYAVGLESEDRGGRAFFFVPWKTGGIIGTAYKPFEGDPANTTPTGEEVETFIRDIHAVYPPAALTPADVCFIHAGILPASEKPGLTGYDAPAKRATILDLSQYGAPENVYAVNEVKYTTAIETARSFLERMRARLPDTFWGLNSDPFAYVFSDKRRPPYTAPDLSDPKTLRDAVNVAVDKEHARNLSDLILRRLGIGGFDLPEETLLGAAADYMAERMDWTPEKREEQVRNVLRRYPAPK